MLVEISALTVVLVRTRKKIMKVSLDTGATLILVTWSENHLTMSYGCAQAKFVMNLDVNPEELQAKY